jgi:ribonuclease J
MIEDYERMGMKSNARMFYSQWPGYLNQPTDRLRAWSALSGIEIELLHTSGHADPSDLAEAIRKIKPTQILPIHTVAPERLAGLFPNVLEAEDGKWMAIR